MSAARAIAAGAAFGACALFGAVRKARAKKELDALSGAAWDIREAERLLRMTNAPLGEIASELSEKGRLRPFWKAVGEGMAGGASAYSAYSNAAPPCAEHEALRVLEELFSSLGRGDGETESKRLSSAADKLDALYAEAEKKAAEKAGITGAVSLLAGVAAALLLL